MNRHRVERRGAILPLIAVSLVVLLGFVAMAIDLGLVALNKTRIQNYIDAAALAGARNLTGATTSSSTGTATTEAQDAALSNTTLYGTTLSSPWANISHGSYHYNSTSQTFTPQIPPVSPDNYNLTQVTGGATLNGVFSKFLNLSSFNIQATAIAAHRPCDVAVVLDFSGSMNNESDLWNCESYLGSMLNTPNNTDSIFPQWGWYAPSFSPNATLQCTTSNPLVGLCNITTTISGVPAMVNDYYSNSRGASGVAAFSAAPSSVTVTSPAGDTFLSKSGSPGTPALTWQDVTSSSSKTYSGYPGFNGYTQGPGYWGKTFYLWPPDPNAANDWRKKFFFLSDGVTPCNNNLALYNTSGAFNNASGNYVINYKAILNWIVNTGPNPFPSQLRAGNVLYYSTIPTDVPASAYVPGTPNSTITNADQRFWKEYIDFVVGVWTDPSGNVQNPGSSTCSYGPDFTVGTSATTTITGPDKVQPNGMTFMGPTDNPLRPRHRFWFGPATLVQYLLDTGIPPGTAHDVSMVAAKLGVAGALQDISNNHPNMMVSLSLFARPTYSGDPAGEGVFDAPLSTAGRNYTSMINALWYPPNSGSADVRPWDSNGTSTPRAHADYDSNTATSYGLMLAYNQFSSNTALQSSGMGGYGRVGAQKIVILETDGMANVATGATTTNAGAYQSYYNIGPGNVYSVGSADPGTDAINAATQICASNSGGGMTGYSSTQKPVIIQTLAFGAIFEPTASGSQASSAVSMLQQISTVGGTVFPSSSTDPTNGYKWCIGTLSQRQSKLQTAFTTILDDSISVILVQ